MARRGARDVRSVACTAEGSASVMAILGSALLCRRCDSFSAVVSCSLTPADLLDFSERKLDRVPRRGRPWLGSTVAIVVGSMPGGQRLGHLRRHSIGKGIPSSVSSHNGFGWVERVCSGCFFERENGRVAGRDELFDRLEGSRKLESPKVCRDKLKSKPKERGKRRVRRWGRNAWRRGG